MKRLPIGLLILTLPALIIADEPGRSAEKVFSRIGGITIAYDPTRWRERVMQDSRGDGKVNGHIVRDFICTAPECRDDPFVSVSARPITEADKDGPAKEPDPDELDSYARLRDFPGLPPPGWASPGKIFGGLALTGRVKFSGCRAWTPAAISASGTHGDFVYRFSTGANFGCSGIKGVPDEMFIELLNGISVDPATNQ